MSNVNHAPLQDQLAELQSRIKADAANVKLRIHLFQLLCVMGNWTRALAQLQVCGQMDAKSLPMAQTYREAIRYELFRAEVFAGKRAPQVMGKPPAWIGPLIEALRHDGAATTLLLLRCANVPWMRRSRAPARLMALPASGLPTVIHDWGLCAKSLPTVSISGCLFQSCQGVSLEPPADLRDLVWASGEVLLPNEGRVPVLVPARYPGTAEATGDNADLLKQSRVTEWHEAHPGMWFGMGQRLWSSDVGEHPILDTRLVSFPLASAEAA